MSRPCIGEKDYMPGLQKYITLLNSLGDRFLNSKISFEANERFPKEYPNFTLVSFMPADGVDVIEWANKNTAGKFFVHHGTREVGFEDPLEATFFRLSFHT